jgi:hypothetical protein
LGWTHALQQHLLHTRSNGSSQAMIYWLLSTWNPWQVIVMQSTIEMAPQFIIQRPIRAPVYHPILPSEAAPPREEQ